MYRQFLLIFIAFTSFIQAENNRSYTFYGFIRNDFFYNSRANEETLDGIFHFYPKPVVASGTTKDINAVPQAEMLSIATRMGVDIKGGEFAGSKVSAKIETDFAGASSTYFLIRIRQAYVRFEQQRSSLLIGQTWHPFFGDVIPTLVSFNAGSPFQPFNRSPQVLLKHSPLKGVTLSVAAIWQMQTSSNGPLGFSPVYMKNSLTPNLFAGVQYSYRGFTAGGALDYKRIMPERDQLISSLSGVAYLQYCNNLFAIKAKTVLGNNMSDHVMLGGYGRTYNPSDNSYGYTNLTSSSSWLNIAYGKKWQTGIFAGYHQNLGSQMPFLHQNSEGKYTIYGRGFYYEQQELLDRMVRIAPFLMHSMKDVMFGVEYNFTLAHYGTPQSDGRVVNPYPVTNHRIVATVVYTF